MHRARSRGAIGYAVREGFSLSLFPSPLLEFPRSLDHRLAPLSHSLSLSLSPSLDTAD